MFDVLMYSECVKFLVILGIWTALILSHVATGGGYNVKVECKQRDCESRNPTKLANRNLCRA